MPYPTPIVEIAFDDGPYVANPTWTAVTQHVRRMSIDRGREDDWGDFNGTASVVLNNRTRLFDPYYTSGTYYGKLLPRKQIRIRAQTIEGGVTTTHDVFRGFIDGWNPEWTDAGTDSTTTIRCFDALQLLAGERLPSAWSHPYILSTSPRHYFPMDEPIQAFTATNVLKDYGSIQMDLTTTNAVSQGSPLARGLPSSAVSATGNNVAVRALPTVYANSNFSAACWIQPTSAGNQVFSSIGVNAFTINWFANGSLQVLISDGVSNQTRQYDSTAIYETGVARHFGLSFDISSKAFQLYVDGIATSTSVSVSAGGGVSTGETINIGITELQQLVIWSSVQSGTVFQNVFNYSNATISESTAARFNRITTATPFPASLTSAASAPANTVLDITYGGVRATDELRTTATSEGGPLFVSKNGTLTMFNQNQIFSQTKSIVSQVTYGAGGTKLGEDVQITADGDSMRNQAYVTMSSGGVFEQANSTSITTYGTASMSIDTHVQTTANAQSLANIATGFGGIVYPDLTPVDVVLSADSLWKPTLDLELMERITVNIAPPTGNTISTPMLVQRITHDVVPGYWQTTLDGSARWAAVFIIGQSLLGGTDLLG